MKGVVADNEIVFVDVLTAYPVEHALKGYLAAPRVDGHEVADGERPLVLVEEDGSQVANVGRGHRESLAEHAGAKLKVERINPRLHHCQSKGIYISVHDCLLGHSVIT